MTWVSQAPAGPAGAEGLPAALRSETDWAIRLLRGRLPRCSDAPLMPASWLSVWTDEHTRNGLPALLDGAPGLAPERR